MLFKEYRAVDKLNFGEMVRINKLGEACAMKRDRMAADVFNHAFTPYYERNYYEREDWNWIEGCAVSKPKFSAKTLAWLSPLVPVIAILKNNNMNRKEFFNPINWLKEK